MGNTQPQPPPEPRPAEEPRKLGRKPKPTDSTTTTTYRKSQKHNSIESDLYPKTKSKESIIYPQKLRGRSSRRRYCKPIEQNLDESEWSTRKLWVGDDYKALRNPKPIRRKRRRRPISGKPLRKRRQKKKKARIQRCRMRFATFAMKIPAKLVFTRKQKKPFKEIDLCDH